ncbi:hypothetical protein AGMMS49949_00930 [Alphaproteobacteria bacterium]|nr:hypothetical protein AGMMS49949_00930 [Alphaproteobacteria bacterium]GHS96237.1 hypothetical protein AGMMS50296_2200 [Alphaproteobacteria bacterium]
MQNITDKAISKLPFEEALGRLESFVATLEQGNVSLDEANWPTKFAFIAGAD